MVNIYFDFTFKPLTGVEVFSSLLLKLDVTLSFLSSTGLYLYCSPISCSVCAAACTEIPASLENGTPVTAKAPARKPAKNLFHFILKISFAKYPVYPTPNLSDNKKLRNFLCPFEYTISFPTKIPCYKSFCETSL